MTKFVGVDYETANGNAGSICSAGFAHKSGDAMVEVSMTVKLHPSAGVQENTWIHGITQEQTDLGVGFEEVYRVMKTYHDEGAVLVSHSNFDRRAFHSACAMHGLPILEFEWVDSLKTSRRTYGLSSNKLNVVADHLGIPLRHHKASSDAAASLAIYLRDGDRSLDTLTQDIYLRNTAKELAHAYEADVETAPLRWSKWEIASLLILGALALTYTGFALFG